MRQKKRLQKKRRAEEAHTEAQGRRQKKRLQKKRRAEEARSVRMRQKNILQKKRRAEEPTESHETQLYTSADFEEVQWLRCKQAPMGCTRAPKDYTHSVSWDQREDFALKTIEP
jgi:hypothetical protein